MPLTSVNILLLLPAFLLVLFRISGLALAAPLLSSTGVPRRVKVAFTLVLSFMMAPVVWRHLPTHFSLGTVIVGVTGELLIGLILGLSTGLVFLGARVAGMLIGQQAGIGLGQVFNPMLEGSTTLMGQLYYLCFMTVFLSIGGHRVMVASLLDTFRTVPPGSFHFGAEHLDLIVGLLSDAFIMAIRLAGPALIALFMTSLLMGFLSRTIPQLNVLTIGFAVRVFVGMSVAAVTLPHVFDMLYDAIMHTFDEFQFVFNIQREVKGPLTIG